MKMEVIGNATLYLGDCKEILPNLQLSNIGTMITDPPYGMSFQSNFRLDKHEKIANDETADLASFVINWGINNLKHSIYAFGRWDNLIDYPKPKSLITWVKNNWSMGDLQHEHARQTEVAFFYALSNHYFPKKRPTDVVIFSRTNNENHPTEKPVGLMQQFIEWTEGIVFDPFMGSGTTGVAAMKMNRQFIGIEINKNYFDIACKRIEESQKQFQMFEV
jgi:DNA modification methylase